MEPEDLLRPGDDEPKAGPDELRTIVARAQRRRWRAAAGGLTAALLIGGGAGYALSNHNSPGQTVATSPAAGSKGTSSGSPEGSSGPSAAAGESGSSSAAGSTYSGLLPQRWQPLFTRMAGSVDIRGFLVSSSIRLPQGYAMPACVAVGPRFEAEVSTAKMVGTAAAGYATPDPSKPLSDVSAAIVGVAEGDPTLVVSAATAKGVTEVKVTGFTGGVSDSMAPVGGWVALAGPTTGSTSTAGAPVKLGTITALSATGQVLASQAVTFPPIVTGGPLPLSSAAGAAAANGASVVCMGSGSGSSGSGSSGSGSSGSGSSGSGTPGAGKSTGTLHVSCPPGSIPPVASPATAPVTCRVTVEPAVTSATNNAAG